MNAISPTFDWTTRNDLDHVIEPLANYICASEKPKTALFSALAALCRQVDATNGLAMSHFYRFAENQ